jgi:uncharacterized protein DUF397
LSHTTNRRNQQDPRIAGAIWRTSSYSGAQGNCIEVADGIPHVISVRDSKAPEKPALLIPTPGWAAFVRVLKLADTMAS